jgi:polar amino acid transport system substrate-binding protein
MIVSRPAAVVAAAVFVLAACSPGGGGATTRPTGTAAASAAPTQAATPTAAPTATAAPSASAGATVCDNLPAQAAGDLLETICERGKILVATDPAYPPQSELLPDGTFEGFDIDTANAIGERLGVDVQFETPNFDEVVAGGWGGRFDISVGSVTVTTPREAVLSFTQPYYYTPAQMAATEASGITTLEGLAGKTICVAEATTYFDWLNGTLELAGGAPEPATPIEAEVTTFSTDTECADAVVAGRTEFEGWLTSSTTLDNSIESGAPFVLVGDPVFYEPLAVAIDKAGPEHAALLSALDEIIGALHEDGTLSESSMNWFNGLDLTKSE